MPGVIGKREKNEVPANSGDAANPEADRHFTRQDARPGGVIVWVADFFLAVAILAGIMSCALAHFTLLDLS